MSDNENVNQPLSETLPRTPVAPAFERQFQDAVNAAGGDRSDFIRAALAEFLQDESAGDRVRSTVRSAAIHPCMITPAMRTAIKEFATAHRVRTTDVVRFALERAVENHA